MDLEIQEQLPESGEMLAPRQERKPARRRHIITFVVITLFNVGLLALLWTQLLTPAQTSSVASQNGTPTSSDPLIGQTAPDFTLASLTSQTNQQISLTEYKGKPVVLNFWSSTCAPCQDEIPLLESQWERYQAQGVVFLGVDVEDTPVDGRLFLHQYGMTYPSVIDSNGSTLVSYGVTYTPETIFIDRTGKVVSAVRMEITSQQLQAGLTKLLG